MSSSVALIAVFLAVVLLLTRPLGLYIAKVMEGRVMAILFVDTCISEE